MITFPLAMAALATQLTITVADQVPRLNVEPVCRGIAQQGGLDLEPNKTLKQIIDDCVASENEVRDQLVKDWSTFLAVEKTNCVAESSAGGEASYTELITCLQMASEVRKLKH